MFLEKRCGSFRVPGLKKALGADFYACFQIATITDCTITEVTAVSLFDISKFEVQM